MRGLGIVERGTDRVKFWQKCCRYPRSQNRDLGHRRVGGLSANSSAKDGCGIPGLKIETWGTQGRWALSNQLGKGWMRYPRSQNRDLGHPGLVGFQQPTRQKDGCGIPGLKIETWGTQG